MKRWIGLIVAQTVIIFATLAYVALVYYENKDLARFLIITGIILFFIGTIIHFKYDVKVPSKESKYYHIKQPWEKPGPEQEKPESENNKS